VHLYDHAPLITMMSAREQYILTRSAIATAGPQSVGVLAELLVHLLVSTTKAQYALNHDRIYVLWGLLGMAAGYNIISSLTPNYRLPIERICHQYAIFMIQYTGDLRILCCTKVD